ncbi:hypothetical protein AVEN_19902-1 [Araneus ventricosus]|uniref:Uncharacterized protein n=1 Tax=Araneus ventricosus TaxID=182803 RepID=A0A4Y2W8J5_ARAVE|nr:hypothetical protein AVEN_19902-1 [Araneus ventricosus]
MGICRYPKNDCSILIDPANFHPAENIITPNRSLDGKAPSGPGRCHRSRIMSFPRASPQTISGKRFNNDVPNESATNPNRRCSHLIRLALNAEICDASLAPSSGIY